MKRVGYYKISYEQLGEYLKLPEDHYVVDVDFDKRRMDSTINVKVIGSRMPEVKEGYPAYFLVKEDLCAR